MSLLLGLSCAAGLSAAPISGKHTFEVGDKAFLLDGKPFVIRCGEMHFGRIPREYWRHRIQMVKASGFNAVCAYVFWNYHEQRRGEYDFKGDKDVAAFCRVAQEEGMWVLVRPGPYTCAEWEFGGLPWWLLKDDGVKLRTSDPRYLEPSSKFLNRLAKEIEPCQITKGGNVLMVQIENEYGFWGNDKVYVGTYRDSIRKAGIDVPLFCCNPVYNLTKGVPDGVNEVANFGSNPQNAFKVFRQKHPNMPLMCGEYYPAWFDSWGEKHNVKGAEQCMRDLEYMLQNRASFSVYMAHGGTSFAWWAGCNAPFRPQTSSYDYDAPVSEAGHKHPTKFKAMRDLFARYLNEGESIPEPPAEMPLQAGECVIDAETSSIFAYKAKELESVEPLTLEKADLGYGLAVYRATIPAGRGGDLKADVRDLGVVRVDGEEVGFLDRRFPKVGVRIAPAKKARTLEILVEPMGRYNFGQIMHESMKGVIGSVMLGGEKLTGWKMTCFDWQRDFGKLEFTKGEAGFGEKLPAGRFYRFHAKMSAEDTYLDMREWQRGLVRVNGHWIGRYWSIGPTQTMYVPGCWLKDGDNEIVIWDAVGATPADAKLKWQKEPILGEMRPETDYFAIQPRPKLAKPLSKPVKSGEFENNTNPQTVKFDKPVKGRYFAIESVDAWDNQPFAACSELDLNDADGNNIPHSKWSIAACDSEERRAEDGSAENIVDGQTANHWHTEWKDSKPNHPHYFVIDLGREENLGGFKFTPRQSNGAGRIRHYRAYVLDDIKLQEPEKPGPALVPYPRSVKMEDGSVVIKSLGNVQVKMVGADKVKSEGYILVVNEKGVKIAASDDAGVFYARETLKQLWRKVPGGYQVPCCKIKDWPEFKWRGVLFDDCRHFFGKAAVMKTMDAMAAHKLNVFHWHLTEDQAWRLAVPKFPELVEYGAKRSKSAWADGLGKKGYDETTYGPFYYTEADVKEILAYAEARHIRVIPEIELPGHAVAAVAAFPNLCCRGTLEPREPWANWGVSKDVYCAGNDETIRFLEQVFDYVVSLFPDPVVHIGGDECPKDRWKECPKCQARIQKEGLKNPHELQTWMTKHFTEYLAKKGRHAIGWDEILDGGPLEGTMIMSWRGAKGGIAAAKSGLDAVMCPTSHCYFDYRQCAPAKHAERGYGYPTWAGELNLQKVYSFNPYDGIPEEFRKHVIGVQCNMWAESIVTPEEHEWKLWPRAAALAEVGWSGPAARSFQDFSRRCSSDMKRMERTGYNVCK